MFKIKYRKERIILLSLLFLIGLFVFFSFKSPPQEIVDSQILEKKILSLGELTTLKYQYKNIISYEDSKQLKGLELPFTTKSFLIVYEGYIKAGVDLKNIDIRISQEDQIVLTLPSAQFTDNVINEEDVVVYDEKSGLFNKIKIQEVFERLEKEKKKMEKELQEKGFLLEANAQAEKLLLALLKEMGFNDIDMNFKPSY